MGGGGWGLKARERKVLFVLLNLLFLTVRAILSLLSLTVRAYFLNWPFLTVRAYFLHLAFLAVRA